MARSKGECSDLKGIFRKFFNATGELNFAYGLEVSFASWVTRDCYICERTVLYLIL